MVVFKNINNIKNNVWKTFILTSIVNGLIVVVGYAVKTYFTKYTHISLISASINKQDINKEHTNNQENNNQENYKNNNNNNNNNKNNKNHKIKIETNTNIQNIFGLFITFILTFAVSMIAYSIMYYLFGYGIIH